MQQQIRASGAGAARIQLYTWPTPNGRKISIMLEECALPYDLHLVDIGAGEQFGPDFLKISPNNKIPAIIDPDGPGGAPVTIFESGAILQYLARKTGSFYGSGELGQVRVDQWLFWQSSGLGPMAEQAQHFGGQPLAPRDDTARDYAKVRFANEVNRLYGVLNHRLSQSPCVAGEYSIADMACLGWVRQWDRQGQHLQEFPHVSRWLDALSQRPAVQRGMEMIGASLPQQGQRVMSHARLSL